MTVFCGKILHERKCSSSLIKFCCSINICDFQVCVKPLPGKFFIQYFLLLRNWNRVKEILFFVKGFSFIILLLLLFLSSSFLRNTCNMYMILRQLYKNINCHAQKNWSFLLALLLLIFFSRFFLQTQRSK